MHPIYGKCHKDYSSTDADKCEEKETGCPACKDRPCKQEWCPFTKKEDSNDK